MSLKLCGRTGEEEHGYITINDILPCIDYIDDSFYVLINY